MNDEDKRPSDPVLSTMVDAVMTDWESFKQTYPLLFAASDRSVATVLRHHLIVEHFIDAYLVASNPRVKGWDGARLTFAQKLALIDDPKSITRVLTPGLKCLNKLRNKIVHELKAAWSPDDIKPIRQFVEEWKQQFGDHVVPDEFAPWFAELPVELRAIEEFGLLAASWLDGQAGLMRRASQP